MYVSAWELDGFNAAQREFINAHRWEYADWEVFADLVADYAEELDNLA